VTSRTITLWSMVVIIAAVVVLVMITAVGRAVRQRRRRSRDRLRDELRPTVVEVLSNPSARPSADLPRRGRRDELFEVLAFEYLAKVKGESRDALVDLLVERGTIDDAERRLRRPGAVGRAAAAEFLGRCGLVRSREPLQGLLRDRTPALRAAGVRALGRLGDPAVIDPLLESIRHGSVPAAIVAQSTLRVGPAGIPALHRAVADDDDAVRSVAVAVLGLQRAIEAVPTLVGVLAGDDKITVRGHAARALGHIGDPRAVDPLKRAAREDPANAGVSAVALGELGDARAIEPLVVLVGDTRHEVATAAAAALTRCGTAGFDALRRLRREGGTAADHAAAAIARAEVASFQRPTRGPLRLR
jgi:HEAT repeat protein